MIKLLRTRKLKQKETITTNREANINEFLYALIEREAFNVYIIIVPKLWWHTSVPCMQVIFYQKCRRAE